MEAQTALNKYKDRFDKMNSARKPREKERELDDAQMRAESYYDNTGKLVVNVPMEQNIRELSAGRQAGKLMYDVEPIGKADMQEIQFAKFSLEYFMEKDDFFSEKKQFVLDKITYGTAAYFC